MVSPWERSTRQNADRSRFERLKRELPIGIYGSFYQERKNDLLRLRDAMRRHDYLNACISEDLDDRSHELQYRSDPQYDRLLSKQLIDRSVAHVFVLAMPKSDEPANLIQSVSMELERLTTLMEYGLKSRQDVMLLVQDGLTDCIAGSAGNVCKGLIAEKESDWEIEYYTHIDTAIKPTINFCYRCVEKQWNR
ncbi:hypothetical protein F8E02_12520 [Methanoculleus sp. Wushi-C6]|uniref:Uncharacterized protein n=1 Tax=Methanoculleus caldifontis TaxID=2651577 RepID=A0ABU3X410_9EURY|nr:hypothetical protein [Methanoculleus sp. Wushi-C6]MDV2482797.1 hypothetical protein [Methanoculleus sp. Wushi-C6]